MDYSINWKKYLAISALIHLLLLGSIGIIAGKLWFNNLPTDPSNSLQVQLINVSTGSGTAQGNSSASLEEADTAINTEAEFWESVPRIVKVPVALREVSDGSDSTAVTPSSVQAEHSSDNSAPQGNTGSAGISNSTEDTAKGRGSGTSAGNGLAGKAGFLHNGDGSYTALSTAGINYKILRDAAPRYPEEARSIGYAKQVMVEARILVGLNGQVEQVVILNSTPNLGFKEATLSTLRQMRFAPIYYQGQNIKMQFVKRIYFQP